MCTIDNDNEGTTCNNKLLQGHHTVQMVGSRKQSGFGMKGMGKWINSDSVPILYLRFQPEFLVFSLGTFVRLDKDQEMKSRITY